MVDKTIFGAFFLRLSHLYDPSGLAISPNLFCHRNLEVYLYVCSSDASPIRQVAQTPNVLVARFRY